MVCLVHDLEAGLQCLKLPPCHHTRVQTTNVLERLFGENRRRVKAIPDFLAGKARLKLGYATMLTAFKRRRGVKTNAFIVKPADTRWEEVVGQSRQTIWAA